MLSHLLTSLSVVRENDVVSAFGIFSIMDWTVSAELSTIKPIQTEALAWIAWFFEGVSLNC
jgi:hypothetical protein